jgi:hypothetical protein
LAFDRIQKIPNEVEVVRIRSPKGLDRIILSRISVVMIDREIRV